MAAAENSLASRLYRGEAGLNIVGRRKMWFTVAAVLVMLALGSILIKGSAWASSSPAATRSRSPQASARCRTRRPPRTGC